MRPGYEPLIQAFSGLSSLNGGPDEPPMRSGASVCDQGTGMWAVIGALALLQRRHRTGRGGMVEASLLETALVWNGAEGRRLREQGPAARRATARAIRASCPTRPSTPPTRPLLICCGNDRLFAKLAARARPPGLDRRRALRHQPRAAGEQGRAARDSGARCCAAQPRADWLERFEAAGVPCAPVHTMPEVLAHPQVQAMGMLQPVPGEDFRLTALPLTFDGERPRMPAGAAAGRTQHPLTGSRPSRNLPMPTRHATSTCTKRARVKASRSSPARSPRPTRCA